VDPSHDTVEVLLEYAHRFQVNDHRWLFLTGEKSQIYTLAIDYLKLFALEPSSAKREFIHSEQAVLIDAKGYLRGYYDATDPKEIQSLIRDMEWLLKHSD
jgi:protein SCO1/2